MTRALNSATVAELATRTLHPALFLKAEFDSGDLNLWTGYGPIDWNGDTWTGSGALLSIDALTEASDVVARGGVFELSGLDAAILNYAYAEDYQGRPFTLYLGFLDDDRQIIADPVVMFAGAMDVLEDSDDGETATVRMSVENALVALERSVERTYTPADQKERYADDTFFDYVAELQNKEIRLE